MCIPNFREAVTRVFKCILINEKINYSAVPQIMGYLSKRIRYKISWRDVFPRWTKSGSHASISNEVKVSSRCIALNHLEAWHILDMNMWMCESTLVPMLLPRWQTSWGQHGAHLGPIGPRWAPCWPQEPYYQETTMKGTLQWIYTRFSTEYLYHGFARSTLSLSFKIVC